MMTLEQLPPKGVKREQAILELGKDEANGELLFQLVNTEKGKCKTAAQKALAQLEYRTAKSELNVDTEAFEVSYNGPEDWYYPLEK